jgi:fatty-acyl-CoA synthase
MTETSPLGKFNYKSIPIYQKTKIRYRAKQGIAFPGVEIRIMTDEGTLAPTDGKSMGELQIKGHGLSILTLKPKPG